MQSLETHSRPFTQMLGRRSPESPPFLNSSHTLPLSRTPSAATPSQVFSTAISPSLVEPQSSAVAIANSSLLASYPAPPITSIASSVRPTQFPTPSTTTSTTQGDSLAAADVPWTTVVWFPPVSAGMTAAIVAATVVPVALILFGGLLLARFLRQRKVRESREFAIAFHSPSATREGAWAGYERVSHTVVARSCGLSVQTTTTEATAIREQRSHSASSISLQSASQGPDEPHFGDTSFLLDGSERSNSSDGLDGDNGSMAETGCDREFLAAERFTGRQTRYYIPSSVLSLDSPEQAFAELNERFGLEV